MPSKLPREVKELLDGKNFGFFATLMADGSPQVTPVWVDRERDTIVINTVRGRTKQRNLSRDTRVALAIVDWRRPYTWAQIRGRVVQQSDEGAESHIDKLSVKYLGLKRYPGKDRPRTIVRIKPEKVTWDKE
jgi:PPOX class probable F420-dependent enzyme